MAFGNSPYNVNRLSLRVFLQDKHTLPALGLGVILNHNGGVNPSKHFSGEYIVFRNLIIPMVRDADNTP